jgi:osmotically-inducible protein OsmY
MSGDIALQTAVLAELNWDPSVPAGQIGVSAKNGVITLNGETNSYFGKHAAESAVGRIQGVTAIADRIKVVLDQHARHDDAHIAAAAVARLASNASIPKGRIIPHVEDGWVTLHGELDWQFERDAAEHDIRPLAGVVGVMNMITVKPRVDVLDVRQDIRDALHRSSLFDVDTIRVQVDGGTVRLSGNVASIHDRKVAEKMAWAAPGAIKVENMLEIA